MILIIVLLVIAVKREKRIIGGAVVKMMKATVDHRSAVIARIALRLWAHIILCIQQDSIQQLAERNYNST